MRAHDITITVLVIVFFVLMSVPAYFGRGHWAESPPFWTAYFIAAALLAAYVLYAFIQNFRQLLRDEQTAEAQHAEARRRTAAIVVLGVMLVIWIVLSAGSFVGSRGRVDPASVAVQGQTAEQGKRVFQAYNCMGCHTIVGNGAYFGPDLTKLYLDTGPAWLLAFLGSAGTWPPAALVDLWIERLMKAGELEARSVAEYYERYPAARKRVAQRGGQATLMPNLAFQAEEVAALAAFLKYASAIDTAGWPAPPRAEPGSVERMQAKLHALRPSAQGPATVPGAKPGAQTATDGDPTAKAGADLADKLGCLACHSIDGTQRVGPTWKGMFGAPVTLDNGRAVPADETYLRESVLDPDAKIVKGFPPKIMPSYAGRVSPEQLEALVAYMKNPR